MSVLFIETFALSWKIVWDSMDNSYCKKACSNGEINVVKITQIRLQNMKKNLAMAILYCFVCKISKKIVFYIVIRREKRAKKVS